ncbi:hypothetical protein H8K47_13330 [Undibacterium sp. CY7W]|uniref:SGNH/GDSL hydrolase family protein n=1 Tax=Undibacterium rugosum TaxID=2762291 RepID=A0A923KZM6_9BURK|nr:hypothetical protein [Undibacterium rugosum]MBC3936348.1 hypothetical protein [Undibacterium rugosum]
MPEMTSIPTVLILTDSLAFPRREPEVVTYEQTWVALLKRRFPDVDFVHCGRGGATIGDLFKHSAYYHGTIKPALVLVQSGIVDCAPRALSVIEQQVLQRLPIVGSLILALVRRNAAMLRRWRKMSYTSLASYEASVQAFEHLFANVHWVGILPVDAEYESRVQGIGAAVDRYNAVLRSRNYISTTDFSPSDIMSDHHHLNADGHCRLATRVAETVKFVVLDGGVPKESHARPCENSGDVVL